MVETCWKRSDKQSPGWVLRWEVLLSICLASLLSPGCAAGLHGKNALVFDQNPIAHLWVVKGCVFECRNKQQNDRKWCKMIHLPGVFQPCFLSFCWFRHGFPGDDSQRVYRPGLHCCTSWWRTQANQGQFRHGLSPKPKLMTLLLLPMTIQRCFFCNFR